MTGSQRGGIIFRLLTFLLLVLLLAGAYALRHPLLHLVGRFWVIDDPLTHADAIIVIGDDSFNGDRAARAAELFRGGWAPVVVASGRRLRSYAGIAELIARDLASHGVPASAIVTFDHDAPDTLAEAAALRPFVAGKHWHNVVIVTSNYHTRRARFIFRKEFPPDISVAVASTPDAAYDPYAWWRHRASLRIFTNECAGYSVAWWLLRGQSSSALLP